MLILSRKPGEEIVCRLGDGTEIVIRLCDIDLWKNRYGINKARIGVQAPRNVTIMRRELLDAKQEVPS